MGIEFTEDQLHAIEVASQWVGSELTIGGYAGTGKTTIIKELLRLQRFAGWMVVSLTGKAVDVLRGKDIPAQTIHGLLYYVDQEHPDAKPTFHARNDTAAKGIIVDEASMIDVSLYRDLKALGRRIVWVGDMGQLQPIGEDPRLMHDPDVRLRRIHRQALQSPITELSLKIREDEPLAEWRALADGSELIFKPQNKKVYKHLIEFATRPGTVVICGFNRSRDAINRDARDLLKRRTPLEDGDKVICLANEPQMGVYNGMTGVIVGNPQHLGATVYRASISVSGRTACTYKCDIAPAVEKSFNKNRWMFEANQRRQKLGSNDLSLWDHAYAITCHKAQGSEADEVAVWDQQCGDVWDPIRWRYTAVTRAKKRLIYCL